MKTKRRLLRLPKRHDKYHALECSGSHGSKRCTGAVEFIASYPWKDTSADRLYCAWHAEGFARRWLPQIVRRLFGRA